ncbi:MAG: adenosylmethionine--8-amino-7-oxononanoate transaminase [Bacteroidales bacterium]|nr:adenosylmethionine--8-amino-7-oxononanoate transaminase [Bacteroidales bacterium]
MLSNLQKKDKTFIWHPYTHVKNGQGVIPVVKARGAHLYDEKGQKIIDAISSWWVNTHGHGHPHIARSIAAQFKQLDHVIFAGFTHKPAVNLAERLLNHLPENQKKVFFSDDGSTAVEIAVKMAIQYYHNKGQKRRKIIAFDNAYHGDTFGAMSVSGKSIFNAPFDGLTFDVLRIKVPISGQEDTVVAEFEKLIINNDVAAFIFEPLVLGAGGMIMYEPEPLEKLISLCRKYKVISIADEVMTGFFRTGTFFACDQLKNKPDIFCISKGVTGGTLPLGITTCASYIYEAFLDKDIRKTLFHGHSYTGNPIVCSAANASLDLYENENCLKNVLRIKEKHLDFFRKISSHKSLKDVRVKGTIMAFELLSEETTSYSNALKEKIYNYFLNNGILLRPLGNVFYILPPYCISNKDLKYIYNCITDFLNKL